MTDSSHSGRGGSSTGPLSEEFLTPGEKFGDYQVLQCLNFGFFGGLYIMEHIQTGDELSVAVMPMVASSDDGFAERFEEYAERLQKLKHPSLPTVRETAVIKDHLCLLCEPIEGRNLNDFLLDEIRQKQVAAGSQPEESIDQTQAHTELALARHDFGLPPKQARGLIESIASSLRFAHDNDLRHLDLNPTNIIRREDGSICIWGYGLFDVFGKPLFERLVSAGIPPIQVGPKKIVINTIDTLSPEVRRGEEADKRSDLFALGLISYFILTGHSPEFPPDPPSDSSSTIMAAWDEIILTCLAENPDERHPSVAAFEKSLKSLDRQEKEESDDGVAKRIEKIPLPRLIEEKIPPKARLAVRLGLLAMCGLFVLGAAAMFLQILLFDSSTEARESVVKRIEPDQMPKMQLTFDPAAAKVQFIGDGSFIVQDGTLDVTMPPGYYTIKVEARGYKTRNLRLAVDEETIEYRFVLDRAWAPLEVTGQPGVTVTAIDDEGNAVEVGTIPASGTLLAEEALIAGTYDLVFAQPNYKEERREGVELIVDEVVSQKVKLEPLPARVRFTSVPEGAYVYLNDQYAGQTPVTAEEIWTETPITVRAILENHRERNQEITLPAGFDGTINFGKLEPLAGAIRPGVTLAGRQPTPEERRQMVIRIDDREVPYADLVPDVRQGTRKVTVLHPDYLPAERTVSITDRQVSNLSLDLRPRPALLTVKMPRNDVAFTVVANGREIAPTEEGFPLPTGVSVGLEIQIENHLTARRTAQFNPNQRITWDVPLQRIPGAELEQSWTVPYISLRMAWIQPGSFTMGSPPSEQARLPVEGEPTPVTITSGFWAGAFEVTQSQYFAIMEDNPSQFEDAAKPVDSVTWTEAHEFCRRLTAREQDGSRIPDGYVYRLPTEAEWEYFCRAGTNTPFTFGAEAGPSQGNYRGFYPRRFNAESSDSGSYGSVAVGQYAPNAFGLHDVHGNVREWTGDWFNSRLPGTAVTDWTGPAAGTDRVVRGGGWEDNAHRCRSAARERFDPATRSSSQGFRIVLAPALK